VRPHSKCERTSSAGTGLQSPACGEDEQQNTPRCFAFQATAAMCHTWKANLLVQRNWLLCGLIRGESIPLAFEDSQMAGLVIDVENSPPLFALLMPRHALEAGAAGFRFETSLRLVTLFFEQCSNGCNADTKLSRQVLVSTARLVQFPDASGVLAGSHRIFPDAFIPGLNAPGGPGKISSLIVAVILDSMNRKFRRRARTHFVKEIFEVGKSNLYAASAIMLPVCTPRVQTTTFYVNPGAILWTETHTMRSVMEI
jgi:hypothetical protein